MFKKKNKQDEIVETKIVEETFEEKTPFTKTDSPKTNKRDNPASFFDFSEEIEDSEEVLNEGKEEPKKKRRKTKEETKKKEKQPKKSKKERKKQSQEPVNDEVITMLIGEEPWIWSDNEETILKKEQETIKNLRTNENLEDLKEEPKNKKELSAYFEESKTKNKKLNKAEKKALSKSNHKGKKNKASKKDKLQEDIKNQKAFRYDGKKYTKVEDFIAYLNAHYLDIEEIAEEVLEDENFFGWINNNSGVFAKSLKEFKEIKAKIENKS